MLYLSEWSKERIRNRSYPSFKAEQKTLKCIYATLPLALLSEGMQKKPENLLLLLLPKQATHGV